MDSANERILALVPNWLGDVAMCTPALRALRQRYPNATLTIAGRKSACDLLAHTPWIDQFVSIPAKPPASDMVHLGRELYPKAMDLAVVFPHSFRAAFLARMTGARQRLGYARNWRSLLLTDTVAPHRQNGSITPIYMADEYLELVRALGCQDDGQGLELYASPEAMAQARSHLDKSHPVIGIAPGAAFGPSKQWPAERYAAVADTMAEQFDAQCVLLTGPGEEDTEAAVRQFTKTSLIRCDDGNPTIESLKAAISQLDLLICNDSGPRHVAIAFGVPTVVLMGPTKPVYSEGPYERGEVLRVDVDCGPCQQPICRTDHRCMTRIPPEQVVEAATRYVRLAPQSPNSDVAEP